MKYDKQSFLAGITVGTQLKGWASSGNLSVGMESLVKDVDITNWDNGSFTVTMKDGTVYTGSVTFDANDKPNSVTLNGYTLTFTLDGNTIAINFPEVE